jgi:hypothetical protein
MPGGSPTAEPATEQLPPADVAGIAPALAAEASHGLEITVVKAAISAAVPGSAR